MTATAEELTWARQIKASALERGLAPVSDFEYMQHAIIAKGNVGKALRRLERLEDFRKEYNLTDAESDDPHTMLADFIALFPGFIAGIGRDEKGHGVNMTVYRKFDPKKIKTKKQWRDMLGGSYYLMNAHNADIADIRAGLVSACDCSGMEWKNFSMEVQRRSNSLVQDAYPVRISHVYIIDAPFIINAMMALIKVFLSKKIKDMIQIEKSDTFYASDKLPRDTIPQQNGGSGSDDKSLRYFDERLAIRLENEATFSL